MMETSHFDIVDGPDCYFDVSLYLFHNENNKQTKKKKKLLSFVFDGQ